MLGRKYYLILLLFYCVFFAAAKNVQATHALGADFSYTCLGGDQYLIRYSFYRDCAGVNAPKNIPFNISSVTCSVNMNGQLNKIPLTGQELEPLLCDSIASECDGGTFPSVQEYVYEGTITLPDSCSDWIISHKRCCRNSAINTFTNSSGFNLYIEANLDNLNLTCNNSPVFSNPPSAFVCVGESFCYNHGAIDPDGDSLVYSLVNPFDDNQQSINYNFPYTASQFLTSNPAITFDSLTGDICMTPDSLGEVSAVALLVEEYRNGVRIGYVVRDIQVRVIDCNNNLPFSDGINATGNFSLDTGVCAGTPLAFIINSNDLDSINTITMTWNGGVSGATFTVDSSQFPTGIFNWVPDTNDIRSLPHCFTITVQDDNCPYVGFQAYSICITVGGVASVTLPPDTIISCTDSVPLLAVGVGMSGLNYLWNTGDTSQTINVGNGTYIVTVSDSVGCSSSDTASITYYNAPSAGFLADSAICLDDSINFTDTSLPGSTGMISWDWQFGDGDSISQQNPVHLYPDTGLHNISLVVTNDSGCTDTAFKTLTVLPSPFVAAGNDTLICANSFPISLNGTVQNATGGAWTGGSGVFTPDSTSLNPTYQPSAAEIAGGFVTLTLITTGNGICTPDSDQVTITIASVPVLSISGIDVSCFGDSNGTATVTASSGAPPYAYLWDDISAQTTAIATGLPFGIYTVNVSDTNGCDTIASVNILQPSLFQIDSVDIRSHALCNECKGDAEVVFSGGTAPYTYSWAPLPLGNLALSCCNGIYGQVTGDELCDGTDTVIIEDNNGCKDSVTFTINVVLGPTLSVTNISDVNCNGANDGTATAIPLGGTVPYAYVWSTVPFQSTATADSLAPGAYCVTVTDANLCDTTECITITEPSLLTATISNIVNTTCNGDNNGQLVVATSGGTAPHTYLWNDSGAQTTSAAIGLIAGSYSVTATDANGCAVIQSATVNEPAALTAAITITNVNCNGGNNGSAAVSIAGGTPVYTYLWNTAPPQTTATASALTSGLYSVTVTDANGCDTIVDVTISEPGLLAATVNFPVNPLCNGGTDGQAMATAISGTPPYAYSWNTSPVQTDVVATGLSNGLYTVSITDTLGCTASATVIIIEPPALNIVVTTTPANCGACDGQSTATASGGTPFGSGSSYIYSWLTSPVQNTAAVTGLCPGSYPVTVSDSNGCAEIAIAVISNQDVVIGVNSVTDVTCYDGSNGQVNVTISSGTSPFTYLWDAATGGQTSTTATGLQAGSYNLTVTDVNGCQASMAAVVNQPLPLISSTSAVDISCNGGTNGQAAVTTPGVSPPYTYLWNTSPVQSSATATGLTAGNYTVTVTNQVGCDSTVTVTLIEPASLVVNTLSVDISCNGASDGTATASVSGGTMTYAYLWDDSGGQTTAVAASLDLGAYMVTVTDANNCVTTSGVTILEPAVLMVNVSSVDVGCNGACDGQAMATAIGGTTAYTYIWSTVPSQSTADANDLCPGNYALNVIDNNGCGTSATVTIIEPALLTGSITAINHVACNGGNDASATATPSGGMLPYTYLWSDGAVQTDSVAVGLVVGGYTVSVTDTNGCGIVLNVNINEPTQLSLSIDTVINVSCNGANDGEAMVLAAGGSPPYTYAWDYDTSQTSFTIQNLAPGPYGVTVTDAQGCNVATNLSITEPAVLIGGISDSIDVSCNGMDNGSATVAASGGTTPYVYLWNDASNQSTTLASGLAPGTYSVTITDDNGCDTSASVSITEPPVLTIDVINSMNISCNGACDGQAMALAFGGTPGYNYVWNSTPLQSTDTATGLCPGLYVVTVIDGNNCLATDSSVITQPTVITSSISAITHASCLGTNNGEATVSPSGGTLPYTYLWDDGSAQSTATATGLLTGTYTVVVTDVNGCTVSPPSTATINEPAAALTSAITDSADVSCNGGSDGSATVTAAGGIFPYQYLWSTIPPHTTATVTGLIAGCYTVTISDDNGCDTISSICINEPLGLTVDITGVVNVNCYGDSTGQASVNALGGTTPYTYSWNTIPVQTGLVATGLPAGGFTATITDSNNCVKDTVVLVTQPNVLSLSTWVQDANCSNSDGEASVIAAGGTAPYSYVWNPGGQTTDSITGVFSGIYNATVTDVNGCLDSIDALINDIVVFILQDSTDDLTCFGGGDGTIRISISSGTPPFDYIWSTGDSVIDSPFLIDSLTNLPGGIYTITVIDTNFCLQSAQVTIGSPLPLIEDITAQDVRCTGANDGSATVVVSDEILPYSYLWSNADTLSVADSLIAGIYTVTVTDGIGCDSVQSVEVFEPVVLQAVISDSMNVSCFGGSDGWAVITASGGVPPYSYSWNDSINQTTVTVTGLVEGAYAVVVTDSLSCAITINTTISEPTLLDVNIDSVIHVSCNGECDGIIAVIASGGTPVYSYFWSTVPQQTQDTAMALCPGNYKITVVDSNGCMAEDSAAITEPTTFTASTGLVTHVSCNGGNNGTASVSGFGGTLPYGYSWNTVPIQTDSIATDLVAGVKKGTVYDANGCSDTVTIVINEPLLLEANITDSTNISCLGGSDGTATITATGGSGVYTYLWSDPDTQITQTATGLAAGNYNVVVTDGQNCDTTIFVILVEPPLLVVAITGITNVSCNGGNDGLAVASPSGGTPPYTYLWDDDSTQVGDSAIALNAGIYTVTVTDTMGCEMSMTDTITEPPLLVTEISSITNVSCKGDSTGTATASVSGGTQPYTYLWNDVNAQTDTISMALSADTFLVMVTDGMGCDTTISTVVTEPDSLIVSFASVTDIHCFGDSTGEITAAAAGGTEPYTYLWNNVDTSQQSASNVVGLPVGTYEVTVTDLLNCTHSDSMPLTQYPEIVISISNDTLICLGDNAVFGVSTTGGAGTLTYTWDDPLLNGPGPFSVSPLDTTIYTVTVTDSLGCNLDDSIKVKVGPVIIIFAVDDSICVGDTTTISTLVTGGDGNYSYLWETGEITSAITINPTVSTYYSVIVDDGCATPPAVDSVYVEVNPFPIVSVLPAGASACETANIGFIDLIADIAGSVYYWDFGDGSTDTTTNPSVNYTYNNTGVFNVSVSVMSPKGCQTDSSQFSTIVVSPLPTANFTGVPVDSALTQPTVDFTDLSIGDAIIGDSISSWYWDFGDGNTSTSQNPVHSYADTGIYVVMLAIVNEYGCTDTTIKVLVSCSNQVSSNDTIVLSSLPQVTCSADPSITTTGFPTVNFTSTNSVQYYWDFGDGYEDSVNVEDTTHTYADTGTYNVFLTVTNMYRCINTCSLDVVVKPHFEIKVPNAFTPDPNGPNGGVYDLNVFDNNVFFPIAEFVDEFHMMIFNRWGELVFESDNLEIGWDGYYRGNLSQADAYAWKIELTFINGKGVNMVGDVTLIR